MTKIRDRGVAAKAAIRDLIKSHYDHAGRLMMERSDPLFMTKAARSIQDGHVLWEEYKNVLPRRTSDALFNRYYMLTRRHERLSKVFR